jgi:uncharacterized protein (TIGR02246 family)
MATDVQPAVPTEATIHTAVDSLVQALSDIDGDAMARCFARDATMTTVQGEFRGQDSIRALFGALLADAQAITIEERGVKRRVDPPFGIFEGVEMFTMKDGTRFRLPYVAFGEFDAEGVIVRWARYSDRCLLVQQGARQMTGPQGLVFRWFIRQVDRILGKDVPTPIRPPA